MRKQQGFTLVELVMVIVLLGIVATISTQFVSLSTQGAIDLGDRQQRALQGVVISEQITREVRNAFPISVREANGCLEWMPILGATTYTDLPSGANDDTIGIHPFGEKILKADNARMIVYGYGSSQDSIYEWTTLPNPGPVSPEISEDIAADATEVKLSAGHRFRERSPQKRIYAVGDPVSICQGEGRDRSKLFRFTGYSSDGGQPDFSSLDNGSAVAGLMSANLVDQSLVWQVTPASLQRSAVVNFEFELSTPGSDETTHVNQEVHIRNVP